MLLADRKELDELRVTKGKTDKELAEARLKELEEEIGLDESEIKLYLSELFDEEKIEKMPWAEQLGWIIQGLYTDLSDVSLQAQLNGLEESGQAEKVAKLRQKKIEAEERRLTKEREGIEAHEAMGNLPMGSAKAHEERRERSQEYAFKRDSFQTETKFAKFSKEQLGQKKEYLVYRIKEREAEVNELRDVTARQQKENAEKVLEKIRPKEYPT